MMPGNGKSSHSELLQPELLQSLLQSVLGSDILEDAKIQILFKSAESESRLLGDDLTSLLKNDMAMLLLRGKLRLLAKMPSGEEFTLAFLSPGDFLDEALLNCNDLQLGRIHLLVSSDDCLLYTFAAAANEIQENERLKLFWLATHEKLNHARQTLVQPGRLLETAEETTETKVTLPTAPHAAVEKRLPLPSVPGVGEFDAAGCLARILAHFKKPPMTDQSFASHLHNMEQLLKTLEQYGFLVQKNAIPWNKLLHHEYPFLLEDEAGLCHWIVGRKGNGLIEEKNEERIRLMPSSSSANHLYNVVTLQPAGQITGTIGKGFGFEWYVRLLTRKGLISTQMVLASVLVQFFGLGMPIFYMVIFDRVFGRQNLSALDIMTVGILLVITVDILVKFLRSYVLSHQLEFIDKITLETMLQKVFNVPLAKANMELTKTFSDRYSEFVKMNQAVVTTLLVTSMDVVFSSIIVIFLLALHAQLALISLISIIPIVLTTFWSGPQIQKRAAAFTMDQRECQMKMSEILQNAETVKSANASQTLKWKLSQVMENGLEKHFGARFDRVNGSQLQGFFINMGSIVTLYFGAHEVLQGEITYGVYMAINMMSRTVVGTTQRMLQAIVQFQEASGSIGQFKALYEEKDEFQASSGQLQLEQVNGKIGLIDLYFRYQSDAPWVLNGLNLEIQPGEKLILAGKSGAGKTTLIRLLQRLYDPSAGVITLDHFNIADMDLTSLRKHMGVALQKPAIFSGTIRDNIMLGNPAAPTKDLVEAVSTAQLEEMLLQVPQGLDGKLAAMGTNLSGGQAARIALARVFLSKPSVLVLDEALAALDPSTSGTIIGRIFEKYKYSTCLFVTDYVPAHQRADRIIVLHEGQIVETGTYKELLETQGFYYHLFNDSAKTPDLAGMRK